MKIDLEESFQARSEIIYCIKGWNQVIVGYDTYIVISVFSGVLLFFSRGPHTGAHPRAIV